MRDLCSARPSRLQLLRTILLLLNSASTFAGLLYWPLPVTTSLANAARRARESGQMGDGRAGFRQHVDGGTAGQRRVLVDSAVCDRCRDDFRVLSGGVEPLIEDGDPMMTDFQTALLATARSVCCYGRRKPSCCRRSGRCTPASWMLILAMSALATTGHSLMLRTLAARRSQC